MQWYIYAFRMKIVYSGNKTGVAGSLLIKILICHIVMTWRINVLSLRVFFFSSAWGRFNQRLLTLIRIIDVFYDISDWDDNIRKEDHDDVIKWKHFPRYWPFVRGIHRSPVNSSHKGQWRGALMFSLICARINGWVNNGEAGDLRRNYAHYDVTVMLFLAGVIKPMSRGDNARIQP